MNDKKITIPTLAVPDAEANAASASVIFAAVAAWDAAVNAAGSTFAAWDAWDTVSIANAMPETLREMNKGVPE